MGHTSCVNACSPLRRGPQLLASASDDTNVRVSAYYVVFVAHDAYGVRMCLSSST